MHHLHRSKSGMSTVLGTLFFVGIMFTCVVPLFLYVNQVNSYYNKTVAELNRFDRERNAEILDVYAYPIFRNETATLNIFIRNRCTLTISVVRVWINDTTPTTGLPLQIEGVSSETLENVSIPSIGDFNVWVVTNRGNVFASYTNTLHINGSEWSGGNPPYSINVLIIKKRGMRSYNVTASMDSTTYSTSGSSVGDQILLGLEVGYQPGIFNVVVTRTSPSTAIIYNGNVTLTPQNPSPWIYTEDEP